MRVAGREAATCADHLLAEWVPNGQLALGGRMLKGYNTYPTTVQQPYDRRQQQRQTLLVPFEALDDAARDLPGFAGVVQAAVAKLEADLAIRQTNQRLQLQYAHALLQGPDSGRSSSFASHRDTDVVSKRGSPPVLYTAIIKLTADEPNESASRMHVADAQETFHYGPCAGDGCWFLSGLWHESLPSESRCLHLKLALFFAVVEAGLKRKRKS